MVDALGVAVVGFGWMGRVHARAYARVRHHYPLLPLRPELITVADEVPGRAEEAAAPLGVATATPARGVVAPPPPGAAGTNTPPNN
ncbi:Gfo/Idh/MocA family oxidoreductase, partial [Streptomyces sp. NPDC059701]|uniref:Gfo/Idh/MocA family oxidoreductase n=1 Tax=Streptomyces sp. NPDC059701 TaxID=3346914 RepID=UPI0036BC4604